MKILLFTLESCPYSQMVVSELKKLGFLITHVQSKHRGESLRNAIIDWRGDLIIHYSGYYILPAPLLKNVNYNAINFHPAPPEYPGSGCASWALYEDAKSYGVTLHMMNEKIDNGRILECRRFPIRSEDNLKSLIDKTKTHQFNLFLDTVNSLAKEGLSLLKKEPMEKLTWHGNAKKISDIDKLQNVPFDCSKEELKKIIRATHSEKFPIKICIHGYEFLLKF
jgi:methionyl-tRNA formyltransferase